MHIQLVIRSLPVQPPLGRQHVLVEIDHEIFPRIILSLRGWSGVAMVSCFLRHRGVQLKLAYSWARPAILVAGKGRGGMFLFLQSVSSLSFLFLFLP